ncbi:MAG: prolyl oligopeptidase family serine peptidase, partial [Pseudomonadota bacterium]
TFSSGNQPPPFQPVGVTNDPDRMLVIAPQRGDGPTGVYEYDVKSRQYTRMIYEHPLADITNFIEDEGGALRQRVIVQDRKFEISYLDVKYQAVQAGLEDYFGPNVNVRIREWSNDEQRAIVYINGPAYPGEYWLFDRKSGSVDLLFRTRENLAREQLGEVEILEAKMSDGRRIYSYVTHPAGGRNKKAPLIILPHGGPQARDSFAYSFIAENQVFASRGYRVIQTQFRGGGGYGWSFAKEGHGEWGDRIQKDVFESAQVLIDRGLAEKKNIGVWGWSHGGYVAGAAAFLNTDVIAASVAGAGVFDLREMINWERNTDGANSTSYLYWKDAIGDPQSESNKLNAASVAENADRVTVPLMLLHGEDDFTVPVDQSRLLRRAMRRAGKDDLLIYKEYKDEPHTPTLANWVDIWERSITFFDEHLRK